MRPAISTFFVLSSSILLVTSSTGCGTSTAPSTMETQADHSMEALEQGKAELTQDLASLLNRVDERTIAVGSKLVQDELPDEVYNRAEMQRDELNAHRDRLNALMANVNASGLEGWEGLKNNTSRTLDEIGDRLNELEAEEVAAMTASGEPIG